MKINSLCVYCGSYPGNNEQYCQTAKDIACVLAENDITLVYGAGSTGIMGTLSQTMLDKEGEVIGVVPKIFSEKAVRNDLTKLHITETMHHRKALMFELSDGMTALPGGIGTVEEIMEVFTWSQLGFHTKPVGLLNICNYYDKLIQFLDHAAEQGFVKDIHRQMILVDDDFESLLDKMRKYCPPEDDKWWLTEKID